MSRFPASKLQKLSFVQREAVRMIYFPMKCSHLDNFELPLDVYIDHIRRSISEP
jgi:hypothetical protein